jgi:hypothetical protein
LRIWLGVALALAACTRPAAPPTPNIDATVQAALEQTRVVEVAVATAVAATSQAQATATAGAAAASTPTPAPPTPAPATPTAPPTATPRSTPTDDRLVIAETAIDGSTGEGREVLLSGSRRNGGRVILLPGFAQSQVTTPMRFGAYVTARVAVFDTRQPGRRDGDGIRRVVFEVTTPGDDAYRRVEESPPFCLFGGNDPACPGLDVRQARADWPDGQYATVITIEALDGLTSTWDWTFCIRACEVAGPPLIEFVQIGRNRLETTVSGELVFQVQAYQEAAGTDDGDGIEHVDFYIYGPEDENQQVWYKRETTPAYCAFGGDAPCQGARLNEPGRYRLLATAVAGDGQQASVDLWIEVQ